MRTCAGREVCRAPTETRACAGAGLRNTGCMCLDVYCTDDMSRTDAYRTRRADLAFVTIAAWQWLCHRGHPGGLSGHLHHVVLPASARDKLARGTGAAAACTNMPHRRPTLPPGGATWHTPVARFALNGTGAVPGRVTLRGAPPDSGAGVSTDDDKSCATPAASASGDRGGAHPAVWSAPTAPATWKSHTAACTASARERCSECGRSAGSAGDRSPIVPLRCLEPAAWGPAGQMVALPARSALPGGKRRPVAGLPGGGGRSRKLEPPPRGPERDHQTSGRGRGGYWQSARPRKLPAAERAAHGAVRSARRRARVPERDEEVKVCSGS